MRRFAIFFLLGLSLNIWAADHPKWAVDMSHKQGLMQVLASINSRHNGFLRSQVRFKADVSKLFRDASKIANELGPLAARASKMQAYPIISLSWSDGGSAEYDLQAIEALQTELRDRLKKLKGANPNLQLTEIDKDLQSVSDKRLLLEVAPLLYDEHGVALKKSSTQPFQDADNELDALSAGTLETIFGDLFKNHLRPKLTSQNGKLAAEVERNFIAKTVRPALAKTDTGDSKSSNVFLEEIPKSIALLRGVIGFDCSMMSVPFYPLLDKVHVHWIRKGKNPKESPRGYILIADIKLNGESIPYVITINGETLSAQDGRAALLAAVAKYKTKKVLVHSAGATGVVNRQDMEEALFQTSERGELVDVEMPEGWKQIDEATRYGYAKYYETSRLSKARLITLDDNETRALAQVQPTGKVGYYPNTDPSKLKPIDRALLFSDLFHINEDEIDKGDLETFDLTDRQARLARELKAIGLKEVYTFKPLPAERTLSLKQFADFKTEFGLTPSDVFRYWNPQNAAQQLITMWRDDLKALFDDETLKNLVEDTRARLIQSLEEGDGSVDALVPLLFNLTPSDINDRYVIDLIGKYGPGAFYMKSAIDSTKAAQEFSHLIVKLVSNYSYNQPEWMRLFAISVWKKVDGKEKSRVYWRQFLAFLRDPSPKVRAQAVYEAHHKKSRTSYYWTALYIGSTDPETKVRVEAADMWRNLGDRRMEFPSHAWPVIEKLLEDSSVEVRNKVLEGLAGQRIWPFSIWQKIPGLLGDPTTFSSTLTAIGSKNWPREVWKVIPEISKHPDLDRYAHESLRNSVTFQKVWSTQALEMMKGYLRARPQKERGSNYNPDRLKYEILDNEETAVDENTFPSLMQYGCESLLNQKREPLYVRVIDRVFEFID